MSVLVVSVTKKNGKSGPRSMQFIGHVISTLFKMAEDAVVQDIGDPQPDNLPEEMPQTDESYAEFQDQSDANGADQNISQDTTLQGIKLKIQKLTCIVKAACV